MAIALVGRCSPTAQAQRTRIVLRCAEGLSNTSVAEAERVSEAVRNFVCGSSKRAMRETMTEKKSLKELLRMRWWINFAGYEKP